MKNKCMGKVLLVLAFFAALISARYLTKYSDAQVKAGELSGMAYLTDENGTSRDLTGAFNVIMQGATKEFIGGYQLDDAFLMWLDAKYGDDVVLSLACHVKDGDTDPGYWRTLTGNSIHVLYLMYCQETGYHKYMADNVFWMDTASEDETVISFTGDFNFADDWITMQYLNEQPNGIYDCISSNLLKKMADSDILFTNNEFCYSDRGKPVAGKAYTFRADPENARLLKIMGVDGVSLANNHVYDYGAEALSDTFDTLDELGIPYEGAGENLLDASKILYYVANGQKIAILSATEIERATQYTREATADRSGVLKTLDPEYFTTLIAQAKKVSDYVIVYPHWGTEGTLFPDTSQKSLAEAFVLAGADAVIGGHTHRLQGAWFNDGVPIAYSLGNFWFSDATLYTTLAQIVITDDGLSLRYQPCVQENMTTRLLTEEEDKEEFYQYLAAISGNIGIDKAGNVYDKKSEDYPYDEIVYDAAECTTPIRGGSDNEQYQIDIVGNR